MNMTSTNFLRLLRILPGVFLFGACLDAQIVVDFNNPAKVSDNGASGFLGTGGAGYDYNGNFGTWIFNNGNMGIDNPAEGDGSGVGTGNAISSIGQARIQDWRGVNARAASVIFAASNFTAGVQYTVSFDVIGDPGGNDAGRYWLAQLSGYDNSGSNYIQIDGTQNGWASAKPFVANGSAIVTYLADSASNGVLLDGENVAGTTTTSFSFTYNAGTDIAFAVGTYNNIFAIDNFAITAPVPEPSTYALITGLLGFGFVVYRRRRRS